MSFHFFILLGNFRVDVPNLLNTVTNIPLILVDFTSPFNFFRFLIYYYLTYLSLARVCGGGYILCAYLWFVIHSTWLVWYFILARHTDVLFINEWSSWCVSVCYIVLLYLRCLVSPFLMFGDSVSAFTNHIEPRSRRSHTILISPARLASDDIATCIMPWFSFLLILDICIFNSAIFRPPQNNRILPGLLY